MSSGAKAGQLRKLNLDRDNDDTASLCSWVLDIDLELCLRKQR